MLSGIAKNGVSRHQDYKIFWGRMPPRPPRKIPFSEVLRLDSLVLYFFTLAYVTCLPLTSNFTGQGQTYREKRVEILVIQKLL